MTKRYENIYVKRFYYFNLYVIKGKHGDVLIDTGFICMKRMVKRWLDKFNIKLVILTHAHVDHIWNVAYIKSLYNCDVALGKFDLENIDNSKIQSKPSKNNYFLWTKFMNLGMRCFVPKKFVVDMLLRDGQIIRRYGLCLKIVSLAGHTNGSVGVLYNDYLFAGDALVYRKKYPEIAYQNQNNDEARKSYEKIINMAPKFIFIGHDKIIPASKLV